MRSLEREPHSTGFLQLGDDLEFEDRWMPGAAQDDRIPQGASATTAGQVPSADEVLRHGLVGVLTR